MNNFYEELNKAWEKEHEDLNNRGYYVHGVKDVYKNNPLISNWVNVHTHGLENYNLTNISIVAPEDDDRLSKIIYTVADMMVSGEQFDLGMTHYIDRPDGTCEFKFKMLPTTCFGEDSIRLVLTYPGTDKFFEDEDNIESIYCLQAANIFSCCETKD